MLLRALFFGIFCFCVCDFFIFCEGADNTTFIWCKIIVQHQHIRNQHTSRQQIFSIVFIQSNYRYVIVKSTTKLRLRRQQKSLNFNLCKKTSIYLKTMEYIRQIKKCYSVSYLPHSLHQQTVKVYFL
jgi:hypothetical protein